jgi:hypothetical protein
MTAMAKRPLKISMERVATFAVIAGTKTIAKIMSPMTILGTTFL